MSDTTIPERTQRPQVEAKRVPIPRWFVRVFWSGHRLIHRLSGGRVGLRPPTDVRYGMLRLSTTGRRSGRQRDVIVAYFEDDANLILIPMNGWAEPEPAWWLNLQAFPQATVELPDGSRAVTAHAADGDERARLWAEASDTWGEDMYAYAAGRGRDTQVVILEPLTAA